MDGNLRLVLFLVAAIIVAFILIESWYRHRQQKLISANHLDENMQISVDPKILLNLESNTHTLTSNEIKPEPRPSYASNTNYAGHNKPVQSQKKEPQEILNDLLVISVVAEPNGQFGSYDLLQAISATGLQFGEMNIFHYKVGNETLFSLASATEPGDFNLDQMGDFFCNGLTLFANLNDVASPDITFELMLKTAEQLAEDLNGQLRAGTRRPWNQAAFEECLHKVSHFQLMKQV